VNNVDKPITCKIRILEKIEDTIDLVKRIEATGVQSIAVHCRTVHERPKDKGHWDVFRRIQDSISIPLIANGDFFDQKDVELIRKQGTFAAIQRK
jgi:tRNA-dihydrouridine synthase 2